jgi:hypothetical protein
MNRSEIPFFSSPSAEVLHVKSLITFGTSNKKAFSIHFCLTYNQARDEVINAFIKDLENVCKEVAASPKKGSDSSTVS